MNECPLLESGKVALNDGFWVVLVWSQSGQLAKAV